MSLYTENDFKPWSWDDGKPNVPTPRESADRANALHDERCPAARLRTEHGVLSHDLAQRDAEIERLKSEVAALAPMRANYHALQTEIERLRAEAEGLHAGLSDAADDLQTLAKHLDLLAASGLVLIDREEIEMLRERRSNADAIELTLRDADKAEIERLRAENEGLKRSADMWASRAVENARECGESGAMLIVDNARLREALAPFVPASVRTMSVGDVLASDWTPFVTGKQMLDARAALATTTNDAAVRRTDDDGGAG